MSTGKEAAETAVNSFSWMGLQLWSLVFIMMVGSIARTLIGSDPFDGRKFAGEMILGDLGNIGLYAGGFVYLNWC